MLCVFAGPVTEDVGLSALLFIGFVSQWWVLLILGAHPAQTPPPLSLHHALETPQQEHQFVIIVIKSMFPAVQMHLQCMSSRTSRTS